MHVSMFCLCSFFRDETSKKDRVGNKPPYFWRSLMCMSLFPQNGIKQRRLFVNQNIFKQYLQSMYMNIHIQIHVCQKDYIYVLIYVYIQVRVTSIYFFQKNMTRKNMRFVNHTQCKHIWPWAKARLKQSESLMSRCWGERRKKSLPAVLPIYLQLFQTSTLRTLKSGTANLRDAPDCTSHTRSH